MKRVLVTGANGFIGRHCLPPLATRGYQVHALARHSPQHHDSAIWHRTDLFDPAETAAVLAQTRPTHLLHLAWDATPGQYWTSTENFRWVAASLNLLDAFARNGGQRVVLAGSCAEYASDDGPLHETRSALAPCSEYGLCKQTLHTLAQSWAQRSGVSLASGRVFHLYGPAEHPARLVPAVVRALLSGEPVECTAGTQLRDFLHVADVAEAIVALLDSAVNGAVNIASGEAITVATLVQEIAHQIGRPELLRLGARPMGEEPASIIANVGRLRHEVGWRPSRTLTQGLAQTIAWWRAQAEAVRDADARGVL